MSQENLEVIRREYDFFNRTGELTAERYHPDFEWHDFEGAPHPLRQGFQEWREWARDIAEIFGEFTLEPLELIDFGDRVLAIILMRARGTASEIALEEPFAVLWEFRDGKVIRGAAFRTRAEALEAAGLSE